MGQEPSHLTWQCCSWHCEEMLLRMAPRKRTIDLRCSWHFCNAATAPHSTPGEIAMACLPAEIVTMQMLCRMK